MLVSYTHFGAVGDGGARRTVLERKKRGEKHADSIRRDDQRALWGKAPATGQLLV
jgi:hypothetical protein